MGFAFSGEERGSSIGRSLTIGLEKKLSNDFVNVEGIEERPEEEEFKARLSVDDDEDKQPLSGEKRRS